MRATPLLIVLALTALSAPSSGQIVVTEDSPYFTDFENGNLDWSVSGTGSTWEWGTPTGSTIAFPLGSRCMATDLDGGYGGFTLTSMEATFDFTSLTVDPVFKMWIWFDVETGDGVLVEMDTGSGIFFPVGNVGDPVNWYESFTNPSPCNPGAARVPPGCRSSTP